MKKKIGDLKLGILGGGQLGRMFIQEALNYNVVPFVMDPDSNAPCAHICRNFINGDLNDPDAVVQFGKNLDVLTIEIEHVSVEGLKSLENMGVQVYPQPDVIRIIQDKGLQKEFYKKNNIPTSEFVLINKGSEIHQYSSMFPIVQKLRTSGYDGRGVQVLNENGDLSRSFDAPSVIEKKVEIDKEISIITARSKSGEVKSFPSVEMDFHPEANLVEFLFSPSSLSKELELKARAIAEQVIVKLDMVGLLAVEMFLDKQGNLLVNEVAPRPHNSGHHTIEANATSQYDQLLRAILDLPLGSPAIHSPAVMVNLLGEAGYNGVSEYKGVETILGMEGVHLHLYGKKYTKPFRKMGHVTVTSDTLESAMDKAKKVKQVLKVIA